MEINKSPQDWRATTLGECGQWLSGGTPSKNCADFWNGNIPWISAKSMHSTRISDSDERITNKGAEDKTKRVPAKTILILVRGSILLQRVPIGITTRDVTFNQDVKAVVPASHVLPEFLLYWLLAHKPDLLNMVELTGIGAGKLSSDRLFGMSVKLPPLLEQKAIAHILGTLDDKIELNQQMNRNLEAIASAIFKSWFVDFDPVRAKMEGRQPAGMDAATAALFPDSLKDSQLGEIPKGWSVVRLADICSTQYGYTASAKNEKVGSHLLRVMDINKRNWIEWADVPYCEISKADLAKYSLKVGDIVVARMADPGKSAIVEQEVDAVFASYLVRLKTESLSLAYYVYHFLKSSIYKDYTAGAQSGSVQANMNAKVITAVNLVLPPNNLLYAFLDQILPIRKKIVINVEQSRSLAVIRDTLLPKLMSGEIRVKEAKEILEDVA